MNQNLIYLPCFALLILSLIVLIRMGSLRKKAVQTGEVDIRFFKTYDTANSGPAYMVQASRNFSNLFEVPTLFYMVCVFALSTRMVDFLFLNLAWAYVILRYLHSFIHLTSNKLPLRVGAYISSWIVLVIMGTRLAFLIF